MARRNMFTVYDAMEAKGVFEANPANASARDPVTGESTYKGPVPYPRMMFHPQGAEKVIVPAEIVVTPLGPQRVGEQRQLIYKIVQNAKEEAELKALGWHSKQIQAVRARMAIEGTLDQAPPMSKDEEIAELNARIAALQAEKIDREAKALASTQASGGVVMPKAQAKPGKANVTTGVPLETGHLAEPTT